MDDMTPLQFRIMLSTLVLLRESPCFTEWWLIGILDKIYGKGSTGSALNGLVRFLLRDKNQKNMFYSLKNKKSNPRLAILTR